MKVRIFETATNFKIDRGALDQLQDQVDLWLKENTGIKIVHIKQSASGGSAGPMQLFISVWYELVP